MSSHLRPLLVLALLGALLTPRVAPTQALPPVPADVVVALQQMPCQDSVTDGTRIEVIDRASGQPITAADVYVVEQGRLTGLDDALAQQRRLYRGDLSQLVACWFGTRYRTGPEGEVRVPVSSGRLFARAGDRLGSLIFAAVADRPVQVLLTPCRHVDVFVTDDRGRPARNVPIGADGLLKGTGDGWYGLNTGVLTDASGHARVPLPDLHGRDGSLWVQALICVDQPVRAPIELDAADQPQAPVKLQLPPCGMVQVWCYDEREQPRPGLRSATLRPQALDVDGAYDLLAEHPAGPDARPSEVRDEGMLFAWVGLGMQLRTRVQMAGLDGELTLDQAGPQRPGELVVMGVRMTHAAPIVRLRARSADGQLLADQDIALLHTNARQCIGTTLHSDADGQLQFGIAPAWLQEVGSQLVLIARGEDADGTRYRGTFVVPIDADTAGIRDLGDVTFASEPVAVAGRVVDDTGKPLAGLVVEMPLSHWCAAALPNWTGANDRRFRLHRAQTDADGRFEVREWEPAEVALPLAFPGATWVPAQPVQVSPGDRRLVVHMVRGCTVALTFADGVSAAIVASAEEAHQRAPKLRGPGAAEHGVDMQGSGRQWTAAALRAGTYSLELRIGVQRVTVLEGVRVEAGQACADPRLTDLDLAPLVTRTLVRVRDAAGRPIEARVQRNFGAGARGGVSSVDKGTDRAGDLALFVLAGSVDGVVVRHPDYRTVRVDEAPASCDVTLVERPRVHLRLPPQCTLGAGIRVAIAPRDQVAADVDGAAVAVTWSDAKGALVRPDGDGPCTVRLLAGDGSVLWAGEVDISAGVAECQRELPIDAETAALVRLAFAEAAARNAPGGRGR